MTTQGSPPRALSHPLPAGMRDLLPQEAWARRALGRRVITHFELHGFQLVMPPAFELAEVLERGLGTLDPADVLRFVEPESGEVAALRPDVTPQIARMVATRLSREPPPIRLCYEGTIVRRRQGRARRDRQISQAGVELYGAPSITGDLEILRLVGSVVREVGLDAFVIDLGHARVAGELIDALPPPVAAEVAVALEHKDAARIDDLLREPRAASVPARIKAALVALPDLHGGGQSDEAGEAVFARAEAVLSGTPAEGPARELRLLWDAARAAGTHLASALRVDLGEVRGFAYYTGSIFHVLAAGPGEPIAAGGRYDNLLARFDAPMPAVGFALNLDAVAWARESAGITDAPPPRVLVAEGPGAELALAALRSASVAAALYAGEDALGYAARWRFTHVVADGPQGVVLCRADGAAVDLRGAGASGLAARVIEAPSGATRDKNEDA